MSSFNDARDGLWFISEHEVEWGFAGGGVGVVIVNKFSHGGVIYPCLRVGAAEDAEIGFNFLVEPFCFSVGLWMICCG